MNDFLGQGGYAAFVWPAYAVSAIGLLAAVAVTWEAWRKVKAQLAAFEARKP